MNHTLFFLHIPKAAGSTFSGILSMQYRGARVFDVARGNGADFREMSLDQKLGYDLVRGHFFYGLHKGIDKPSKYATFVRNPIERLVSLYYHDRRAANGVLVPFRRTGRKALGGPREQGRTRALGQLDPVSVRPSG